MYEQVYHGFLLVCMIVLGALIMLCLLRAILGPRLADRVVAVNMIGTMTITEIANEDAEKIVSVGDAVEQIKNAIN